MTPKHRTLPKLDLNVTNRCNYRCVHCAFDSGRKKMPELTLKELETLLCETKELGGRKIDITGGEPTLRKDLEDIVKIARALGYKIELVSNASLLTKEKLFSLREAGITSLAVSVDGSTYERYNRIRPVSPQTYAHVKEMIKTAISAGIPTKINTVVFSSNIDDIANITRYALDAGAVEHGLYYFTPVGRGARAKELSVEPAMWLEFIRKHLAKYAEGGELNRRGMEISLEFPFIENDSLLSRNSAYKKESLCCHLENDPFHLQILPDGNVYPCAIMAFHEKPIANLHERSVKEIWDDAGLWRDYLANVRKDVFDHCAGACTLFHGFDASKYLLGGYTFVCPLRKFSIGDAL